MTKGNTLTEVAKHAGVSTMTASRALHGTGYVSEAIKAKVVQAAAELNYTPNLLAQRMRGGRGNLIGVFINHFASAVMHELIISISAEARRLGYNLVIFNSADTFDNGGSSAPYSQTLQALCDGLLLVLPHVSDRYLDRLDSARFPVVLVNYCARELNLPTVSGDNRMGAMAAVNHLLSLGHRRIAFITGTSHTGQSTERQRGYEDALRAAGIDTNPDYVVEGDFSQMGGVRAAERLLALPARPSAVFAANDETAFGVMDTVQRHGLRVPDDISVVGFDDIAPARYVFPALTTLRQPLADIGVQAVQQLVRQMKGEPVAGLRVVLPTEMILRSSTGPAPA